MHIFYSIIKKLMTWEAFLYCIIQKSHKNIGRMNRYSYVHVINLLVLPLRLRIGVGEKIIELCGMNCRQNLSAP
jgi:hypothetical protein